MSTRPMNVGGRGILGHRRHDVLDALAEGVPMTVDEVCTEKGTDYGETRCSLDALVTMGLVEMMKARSESDRRRKVRVYLITAKGVGRLKYEKDRGHEPGVPPRRVREIMKRRVAK